jgi:hypothetical protein
MAIQEYVLGIGPLPPGQAAPAAIDPATRSVSPKEPEAGESPHQQ